MEGWNWIGYPPFEAYNINSNIEVVSGAFSIDDQIKTRSGSTVRLANYGGDDFRGDLFELEPGVGYEFRVAQAVTFRYTTSG